MYQRQIDYFLAVCEAGSITKAAEKLFMTRQALSNSIRLLETELGMPLFERSKQGVMLSWEGLIFKSYAEKSAKLYKDMLNDVRQNQKRHTLKVGAPLFYMDDAWVRKMLSFSRGEPSVMLSIENDEDYTGFFDKLLQGMIDIAWTRIPPENEKLQYIKVQELKLKIVVSKNSELAKLSCVDYKKDLFGKTHLCVSQDTVLELIPHAATVGVECRLVSAQTSLVKSMVAEDEGFIVIPEGYGAKLLSDQVVERDFVNFPVSRGIYLVFKAAPSDCVIRFVEFFTKHVAPPDGIRDSPSVTLGDADVNVS